MSRARRAPGALDERQRKALVEHVTRVLDSLARGALAVLDAHFYSALGLSFPQALAADPALAYSEAAKVMPESMVRTMLRTVLRSLGAGPEEIEAVLEGLRAGDGSRFLELATRALRDGIVKAGPGV